jgi:hypothetical protein
LKAFSCGPPERLWWEGGRKEGRKEVRKEGRKEGRKEVRKKESQEGRR